MKQILEKKGFTLIELLVVIFMTTIIATISLANYRRGEKNRQVSLASDIITSTLTSAQNYALTGRSINNGDENCRKAEYYFVKFEYLQTYTLKAHNTCGNDDTIETFKLPPNTRFKPAGLILGNAVANGDLSVYFSSPYAKITGSKDGGAPVTFSTSTITIENIDLTTSKTITVDGLSGRISQ